MNRLSNSKTTETTKTPSLQINLQNVVRQNSHSSRIFQAIRQYDLYIKDTECSLFERLCTSYPELISAISFNSTLQTVLSLRLVSKKLHESASLIGLLEQRAAVICEYKQLQVKNSSVQEKIDFAIKEKMDVNIITPVAELPNLSSLLLSVVEEKMKIILLFTTIYQLKDPQTLLLNISSPQFLPKIKELDINFFNIAERSNDSICSLLDTISKNIILFPNLKSLILGHFCEGHKLIIPYALTSKLQHFTIDRGLCKNTSYIMPNSFTNLVTITIGALGDGAYLQLPSSLPHLTRLTFENIDTNVIIILPSSFDKLTTITVGNISDNATRQLFSSLIGPGNSPISIIQKQPKKQPIEVPNFNVQNMKKNSKDPEPCIIS